MDDYVYRNQLSSRRLIVLLVSLIIIPGLAFVFASGHLVRTRIVVDGETVRGLNTATSLYVLASNTQTGDAFAGITTDAGRLAALVAADFYDDIPRPQYRHGHFVWQADIQLWTYRVDASAETVLSRLASFGTSKSALLPER